VYGLKSIDERILSVKGSVKIFLLLIVASLVIFAPGNFNRMSFNSNFYDEHDFFTIIMSNATNIGNLFFCPREANIFIICQLFSLVFLVCYLFFKKIRFRLGFLMLTFMVFISLLCDAKVVFGVIFIVVYSIVLLRVGCLSQLGRVVFAVHIGALVSLLPLLYMPNVAGRSGIIYFFLEFVPILYSMMLIDRLLPRSVKACILAFILMVSFNNVVSIYKGYQANDKINKANDITLRTLSYKLKHQSSEQKDIKTIQLVKLKEPYYAEVMPYQRPLIERWMKKYYVLEPKIKFHWISPEK